jgi:hypothetical protein
MSSTVSWRRSGFKLPEWAAFVGFVEKWQLDN